jgi:hypothetical protein
MSPLGGLFLGLVGATAMGLVCMALAAIIRPWLLRADMTRQEAAKANEAAGNLAIVLMLYGPIVVPLALWLLGVI